jgi:hypothetical protein
LYQLWTAACAHLSTRVGKTANPASFSPSAARAFVRGLLQLGLDRHHLVFDAAAAAPLSQDIKLAAVSSRAACPTPALISINHDTKLATPASLSLDHDTKLATPASVSLDHDTKLAVGGSI